MRVPFEQAGKLGVLDQAARFRGKRFGQPPGRQVGPYRVERDTLRQRGNALGIRQVQYAVTEQEDTVTGAAAREAIADGGTIRGRHEMQCGWRVVRFVVHNDHTVSQARQ